jgi:low density lipoprotein receptor-related protein 5/6
VYEANLDGSDAKVFYSGGLDQPYALAVDYVENKLYWGDARTGIWYANLDGTNVQVLRNSTSVHQLYGLTQFEEYVWWSDQSGDALRRAPKRASSPRDDVRITSSSFKNLFGLQIAHPYRQPSKGFRVCTINRGGCSHLCQPTADSYTCKCPQGFSMGSDNHTCIELPTSPPPTQPSCTSNCSGNFKGICKNMLILLLTVISSLSFLKQLISLHSRFHFNSMAC